MQHSIDSISNFDGSNKKMSAANDQLMIARASYSHEDELDLRLAIAHTEVFLQRLARLADGDGGGREGHLGNSRVRARRWRRIPSR